MGFRGANQGLSDVLNASVSKVVLLYGKLQKRIEEHNKKIKQGGR